MSEFFTPRHRAKLLRRAAEEHNAEAIGLNLADWLTLREEAPRGACLTHEGREEIHLDGRRFFHWPPGTTPKGTLDLRDLEHPVLYRD